MAIDELEVEIVAEEPMEGLAGAVASARGYADDARAPSTRRAYRTHWAAWVTWCQQRGFVELPATPATVAVHLAELADRDHAVSTIEVRLVAISQAHRMADHPSPRTHETVRSVLKGIRRRLRVAPRQKAAVTIPQLLMMVSALPATLRGARDRAVLLMGFASACRRSELVGFTTEDVVFETDGVVLSLRRSKTDTEGIGRKIGIPKGGHSLTCPVRALRAWLDAAGISEGAVFRSVDRHGRVSPDALSDRAVARIVQQAAATAGLDPSLFAGHSLRAGLATAAARAGKSERSIMDQTGHRSTTMVRRYIRAGGLFTDNAAAGVGL